MKTVVLYCSKTGATKEYASQLAKRLEDCAVIDIGQQTVDVQNYDRIILGCGLRIGKAYKQMRTFMKKNLEVLRNKQLWIFFCGADEEGFAKVPEANIPEELQATAKSIVLLKGKQPFQKDEERKAWFDEKALDTFIQDIENS